MGDLRIQAVGEMTMNKAHGPILVELLLSFAGHAFVNCIRLSEAHTEQKLSSKQLTYLLKSARTPDDHPRLAANHPDKGQQLRKRSAAHTAEANGYARRTVFELKTGIPGGTVRYATAANGHDGMQRMRSMRKHWLRCTKGSDKTCRHRVGVLLTGRVCA